MSYDAAREKNVEDGIKFIMSHLGLDVCESAWPREIATRGLWKLPLGRDEQDVLVRYKIANLLDCRIKAYQYTDDYLHRTNDAVSPSVLFIDIDRKDFKTTEEFESCVDRTCTNFKEMLGCQPTQLWSGNGTHFICPQYAPIFEKHKAFSGFKQPSRRFLQFEGQFLTGGMADHSHSCTVSFNNCWLRVPGSLNSKYIKFNDKGEITDIPYEAEVRIIKRWDGNRPSVEPLLTQYYIWLHAAEVNDINERIERARHSRHHHTKECNITNRIGWIDKLLDKPILNDSRKYCIWRVFAPYLINIRGLPRENAFNKISSWLDGCDSVCRLNFNVRDKINYGLNKVEQVKYLPVSRVKLERENPELYKQLRKEGIMC